MATAWDWSSDPSKKMTMMQSDYSPKQKGKRQERKAAPRISIGCKKRTRNMERGLRFSQSANCSPKQKGRWQERNAASWDQSSDQALAKQDKGSKMQLISQLLSQTKREKTGQKSCDWLLDQLLTKKEQEGWPRRRQLVDCFPKQKGRKQERKAAHRSLAKKGTEKRKGRPRHSQSAYCSPKDEREKTGNKDYRLRSIVESISHKKTLLAMKKRFVSERKIDEDHKLLNFFSRRALPDIGIPSLVFLDIVPISRKARLSDWYIKGPNVSADQSRLLFDTLKVQMYQTVCVNLIHWR